MAFAFRIGYGFYFSAWFEFLDNGLEQTWTGILLAYRRNASLVVATLWMEIPMALPCICLFFYFILFYYDCSTNRQGWIDDWLIIDGCYWF